jgi:hypothetical protein
MKSTHTYKAGGARAVIVNFTLCALVLLIIVGCSDAPKPPAGAKKADDKPKVSQTNTNALVFETKSVFDDDANSTKDPFFPKSRRRLAKASSGRPAHEAPRMADLHFRGVIGSPGRYIAMINDKTFAVGEKSQVLVGPGQYLVVKVNKITEKSVNVSVDGEAVPRDLSIDTTQEAKK